MNYESKPERTYGHFVKPNNPMRLTMEGREQVRRVSRSETRQLRCALIDMRKKVS